MAARDGVEGLLWDANGGRRVPSAAAFDRAVAKLRRGELERLCEFNPLAPIYLIPTRPFLRALARRIRATGARTVLEVAAGDGLRLEALDAIQRLKPDLVLASWLPPGPLLGRIIRAAPLLLEIGAGSGITGDIRCWRYPHDFCDDLDALARCRLDERPAEKLHTRVTLYRR